MKKGTIRILLIIMAMCLLSASLVGAMPLSEESQSEVSQPESSQPDTSHPESSQPESSQPDTSQPESSQPDTSQPDTPIGVSGVSISFSLPRGWYTKTARVGVALTDLYDVGINKVEAKSVQNGSWTDITDTLYLDISDNGTIYVQVTDRTGNVTAKSVYVECFDRGKPTVRASRSGRLLRIEASDELSGVAVIYVDGVEYTDLADGTVEVRINSRDNTEEKIWIQARDYAGNLSATYTLTNPYYTDPDAKKDTSCASSQESEMEKSSGNSTTSSQPDGSGSTTSIPPSEKATAAITTSSSEGSGAAAADTGTEAENSGGGVIAVGDKQFITIETRDGKIFYLIIDGGRESDNVYLVTEVTTQDLQSFTTDEAGLDTSGSSSGTGGIPDPDADTDILIDGGNLTNRDSSGGDDGETPDGGNGSPVIGGDGGSSASESPVEDGKPEETGKKANPIPGWIVIALIICVAAFAGYMFLVVLPRKKAKEALVSAAAMGPTIIVQKA